MSQQALEKNFLEFVVQICVGNFGGLTKGQKHAGNVFKFQYGMKEFTI